MIARAITAIIGVVIGLFATFAVFSAILGGLDSFYLLTQDACNYGSINSPKRVLRVAPENPEHPRDADEIDWSRDGLDLTHDGSGGCVVEGGADVTLVYLSPTGERVALEGGTRVIQVPTTTILSTGTSTTVPGTSATPPTLTDRQENQLLPDLTLDTASVIADIWVDNTIGAYHGAGGDDDVSPTAYVFNLGASSPTHSVLVDGRNYGPGIVYDEAAGHLYLYHRQSDLLHRYTIGTDLAFTSLSLSSVYYYEHDFDLHNDTFFMLRHAGSDWHLDTYTLSGAASDTYALGDYFDADTSQAAGLTIYDGGGLMLFDRRHENRNLYVSPDYTNASSNVVILQIPSGTAERLQGGISISPNNRFYSLGTHGATGTVLVADYQFTAGMPGIPASTTSSLTTYSTVTFSTSLVTDGAGLPWIPAENVFTAQEQLVTLLAVIAAIGMPIGAMTAIVFFGQAVISSGMSGQGASQVLVAIAAVVVILVSIQMFQQFAGFLGTAFDAVNGDRFVVFDESLGSLAETIAEFWGVLAFAGFINIAAIVWRNYSGNFSIGGNVGGL